MSFSPPRRAPMGARPCLPAVEHRPQGVPPPPDRLPTSPLTPFAGIGLSGIRDDKKQNIGRTGQLGGDVRGLLAFSRGVDWFNSQLAVVANWLVLLAAVISAGNAASRYLFSESSNGWLEIQWYMFAGMVLLGAPYTLKRNEHVRVDLVYGLSSERTQIWIDIVGGLLFLLPICVILTYFTWPWFVESWTINEASSNAGGLIRWPVKLLLPVGFFLMALQGISEIIKRIAALEHVIDIEFKYEKPLQ
jgi:TRAP-type mannitol/chloroaromatic compound transport system permease small subunit